MIMSSSMRRFSAYLAAVALIKFSFHGFAEIVHDPIEDFLNLPISDRYTSASEVSRVVTMTVDIDRDGDNDMIVGHQKMWLGNNIGLYSVFYENSNGTDFERLTPPDSDVAIDPRFFGDRSTTFVGYIHEVSSEGILVLSNNFYQEGLLKFAYAEVYSIADDKLVITELGAVDRTTKQGQEFYDRYFGKGVESRSIERDEFSSAQLQELGYRIPSWKIKDIETVELDDAVLATPSPPIAVTPETTRTPAPIAVAPESTRSLKPVTVETESSTSYSIFTVAIFGALMLGVTIYLLRRKST